MQIEFNDQDYKLETLKSLVGFGRQEKVNASELIAVTGSECDIKVPVCFVYDGQTYVLAGKIDTSKSQQTVSILTKHVLKKALMSVQSQPMDTRVDYGRAQSVPVANKAQAALARLSANSSEESPRRERTYNKPAVANEQTRNALRILEATLSRKEETVENSDWN